MEQEAVEYMLFLKKNTTELRKLGSDWGLTEDEINGCITEALLQVNVSSEIDVNSKKNMARKIWSHILFLVKIPIYTLLFMVGLLVLVTIVCTLHEPTDKFFTRKLAPHGYSIFRFIRLATLPLHRIANVTSMAPFMHQSYVITTPHLRGIARIITFISQSPVMTPPPHTHTHTDGYSPVLCPPPPGANLIKTWSTLKLEADMADIAIRRSGFNQIVLGASPSKHTWGCGWGYQKSLIRF